MQNKWVDQVKVFGATALTLGVLMGGSSGDTVDAAEVNHTVQPGDTLFEIAAQYFGEGSRYHDIASVNEIVNPDLIYVGQVLTFDDEMDPILHNTKPAKAASPQEVTSKPVEKKSTDAVAEVKETPKEVSTQDSSTDSVPEYVLKVVQSEAGPSYQEKANVFSVIVNRVNSGRWGGTDYMSVVKAPGQFQVTWNGMADNANVDATTRQAVADVLANGVTTSAESFRASGDGVTNVFF